VTDLRHVDVVVVGAGIAGLTAARRLLAAGRAVAVHEARDRVGGRLLSVSGDTGVVDLGATWFWPNESHVQALAEQLGVGTFEQSLAGDAMFEADGRGPQRISGNPVDVRSGRFAQGAQALCQRAAEQLPPGTLRLADPVTAVHVREDHVLVQAASGTVSASHVVLAVPPALAVDGIAFAPELPEPVRILAASTAVWMGATTKAVAVYDGAFWRDDGLAGAAVSHRGPFRELHDHSGPEASPAAIFGFAGSDQIAQAMTKQLAAAFIGQLTRLFGPQAASPLQVHVVDWSRERWTSPTNPSPRASTATYSHPQLQEPLLGRLHWASTETAPAYAGHIEGAIRAGAYAADTIVRLLDATPDSAPNAADALTAQR
jgi:monoamine oxidase